MKIERYKRAKQFKYIPFVTGIDAFDSCNAIGNDDFVVIAGGTGSGKSYLSLWIGLNIAKNGKRVLYINQETLAREFCDRIDLLGFDYENDFGEADFLGNHRFLAVHRQDIGKTITFDMVERWVKEYRPDVLILDLFSSLMLPGCNIPTETELMSSRFKFFATQYGCSVIAVEQFSKEVKGQVRPNEDYIRGGKGLPNWATKIFTIYQYYRANPEKAIMGKNEILDKTVEVIVRKDGTNRIRLGIMLLYRDFGYRQLFDNEKETYYNIVFKR